MFCLIHSHLASTSTSCPRTETLSDMPHAQTLFTPLPELYIFSLRLCTFSFFLFSFLRTLFSVHLSHYGLAISSGVENEVLISLLINLSSPEVPESLPASQNDDWHFYLFGEISVGAKLNFNGSCIPPVRGAIHYWMIVMLFVASVDLWYISCRGPKVGTLGKEAVWCVDGVLTTAQWREDRKFKSTLAVYLPHFQRDRK